MSGSSYDAGKNVQTIVRNARKPRDIFMAEIIWFDTQNVIMVRLLEGSAQYQ
jgi:hypothetical protein